MSDDTEQHRQDAVDGIEYSIYSGAKKYCQPPIVQVLPLKKMRPVIFIIGTLQL